MAVMPSTVVEAIPEAPIHPPRPKRKTQSDPIQRRSASMRTIRGAEEGHGDRHGIRGLRFVAGAVAAIRSPVLCSVGLVPPAQAASPAPVSAITVSRPRRGADHPAGHEHDHPRDGGDYADRPETQSFEHRTAAQSRALPPSAPTRGGSAAVTPRRGGGCRATPARRRAAGAPPARLPCSP
jgi:hypothetical protein